MISRITQTALAAAALTTAAAGGASAGTGCVNVEQVKICGDWSWSGSGRRFYGDVTLHPAVGGPGFDLTDASIYVAPGTFSGEATFNLPAVHGMGAGASGGRHGEVSLFTAAPHDRTVDLGNIEIPIEHGQSAVIIDFEAGLEGSVGALDISNGEAGAFVLVPSSQTVYVSGAMLDLPTGRAAVDAFGISLGGAMRYSGTYPLVGPHGPVPPDVDNAHLYVAGTIPVGNYPIELSGDAIIDWNGDADTDFILAASGQVDLGYTLGNTSFTVPVGEGALLLEGGDDGAVYVGGSTWNPQWLEGTPLAMMESQTTQRVWAWFDLEDGEVDDFLIGYSQEQATMAGFALTDFTAELTSDAIRASATLRFGNADFDVEGEIQTNGDFSLTGSGVLNILGAEIAQATVTFDNDGVRIAGRGRVGDGYIDVDGEMDVNGDFSLTGTGAVSFGQMTLADALITIDNRGGHIEAGVNVPGLSVDMEGSFSNGGISLSTTANMDIAGLDLGTLTVSLSRTGIALRGKRGFAGVDFVMSGEVRTNGNVSMSGSVSVGGSWTFAGTGASLDGTATLSFASPTIASSASLSARASVRACGHLLGGKECASRSSSITSSGKITIRFPGIGSKTVDIL